MSGLDLDNLLNPVSPTEPSGPDLAYTPDFQQLLDAAEGQPERVMGDNVVSAVEPDWQQIAALGVGILSRSKDIRVAILLCQALLHTEGLPGLASGMSFLSRLLTDFWDNFHPQLDAADNNDPTERMNALLNLCDQDAFLTPVRRAPLASSRTFGTVSLREIEIAKGESPLPEDEDSAPPDTSTINAVFLDCEIDRLRETAGAVSSAVGNLEGIDAYVADRVGGPQAPDLSSLHDLLAAADALLKVKVSERVGEGTPDSAASPGEGPAAPGETGASAPAAPQAYSGSGITSRDDVVRMLDKICDYYARNEPSSPVPLLLRRAQRLVAKDFMGIMQELAPGAVAQIEAIRGSEGDG
jgi:type VI secretion system protein ImpA